MNKYIETKINQLNYYTHAWLQVIQSVLLTILLTMIYFVGIGITFLLLPLMGRHLIKKFNPEEVDGSYWKDAENYDQNDLKEFEKQV